MNRFCSNDKSVFWCLSTSRENQISLWITSTKMLFQHVLRCLSTSGENLRMLNGWKSKNPLYPLASTNPHWQIYGEIWFCVDWQCPLQETEVLGVGSGSCLLHVRSRVSVDWRRRATWAGFKEDGWRIFYLRKLPVNKWTKFIINLFI